MSLAKKFSRVFVLCYCHSQQWCDSEMWSNMRTIVFVNYAIALAFVSLPTNVVILAGLYKTRRKPTMKQLWGRSQQHGARFMFHEKTTFSFSWLVRATLEPILLYLHTKIISTMTYQQYEGTKKLQTFKFTYNYYLFEFV